MIAFRFVLPEATNPETALVRASIRRFERLPNVTVPYSSVGLRDGATGCAGTMIARHVPGMKREHTVRNVLVAGACLLGAAATLPLAGLCYLYYRGC